MDRLGTPSSVFLTSVTGFIGSSLLQMLRQGGWDIQALVLPGESGSLPPDR